MPQSELYGVYPKMVIVCALLISSYSVEVSAILAYNTITADLTKRWLHVTHVDLHLEVCILVMGGGGGGLFYY